MHRAVGVEVGGLLPSVARRGRERQLELVLSADDDTVRFLA